MENTMTKLGHKAKPPASVTATDDPNTLRIKASPDLSEAELLAKTAMDSITGNAVTARTFTRAIFGESDLNGCVEALRESARRINTGDLTELETTLTVQAISLDKIFNELARRAALNIGEYIDATDRYMRLALKAQSQCRATLETLANIKNPPLVFARQANFANGPQQVNNGMTATGTHAHAGKSETLQNELLGHQHGNTLDSGTAFPSGGIDSHVEAVGTVNRAAHD
jgi:hypothetical protein